MSEELSAHNDARAPEDEGIKPESALHRLLREHIGVFLALSAAVGAAYAVLFTETNGLGVNVPIFSIVWVICAGIALMKLKLWDTKKLVFYIAGILLLSLSASMTLNEFVQAVDCLGIVLLMVMLLLSSFSDSRTWQFGKYFTATAHLIGSAFKKLPEPFKYGYAFLKGKKDKLSKAKLVLLGIFISLPLATFALFMLTSADMMFNRLVESIFTFDATFLSGMRVALSALIGFLMVSFAFYCVFAGQAEEPAASATKPVTKGDPAVAVTFMGVLTVIYVVFSIVQIVYLFAGSTLPEGYTYSGYARQGFFQLLFVSMLNVSLVIFSSWKFGKNKALVVLLTVVSACTYVMIASSAFRMLLYVEVYGLTFLRILVLWFLAVLGVIMGGTAVYIYKSQFPIFRFSLVVSLILWLAFSFAKPDRIAARYNAEVLGMNDDTAICMLYDLSMDAVPVMVRYDYSGQFSQSWAEYLTHTVKNRYCNYGVRSFNFSLWEAVRAVRD